MDISNLPIILVALAALYCAGIAGSFSKFFMSKAKIIKALQGLHCTCEDGVITAADFSTHRLVELAAEEMGRAGHGPQRDAVLAMHAEVARMQEHIQNWLDGEKTPEAVSSCKAVAEALQGWLHVAYALKPSWDRVLVPFRRKKR